MSDDLDDLSFWPDGADEDLVRHCALTGCEFCGERIEALDDWRDGIAPDGQNQSLTAFTEASADA